jgi:hypothetical protein
MKQVLFLFFTIGMVILLTIGCKDQNPLTTDPPVDSSDIEWPKIEVIRNDTAYMTELFVWKIIVDNISEIDSLSTMDSIIYGNGSEYVSPGFRKEDLKDTITLIGGNLGDDNAKHFTIIRMFSRGIWKDTIDSVIVVDNQEVEAVKGTFYPQDLRVGDTLQLYVIVESLNTAYTCQWYRDGVKVGNEFVRQGDDSIYYIKPNVQLEDSGEYCISMVKPHAGITECGMQVIVRE